MDSSLRFIAHVIMGAGANVAAGFLVARVKVRTLAVVSALITMVAAPLMATVNVGETYWYRPFWALFLSPVNPDGALPHRSLEAPFANEVPSFTSSLHRVKSHHLGSIPARGPVASGWNLQRGGTVWQLCRAGHHCGNRCVCHGAVWLGGWPAALMKGYRAAFWTIFASCSTVTVILWFGLRKGGIVGKKDV